MNLYEKMHHAFQTYNPGADLLKAIYGLDSTFPYDAILVAPSWTPERIFKKFNARIRILEQRSYYCSYEIEIGEKTYGYVQTGSCGGNVIDCCMTIGKSACKQIIFVGAVGALTAHFSLGDLVTPSFAIAGDGGSLYLYDEVCGENLFKKIPQNAASKAHLLNIATQLNIPIKEAVTYCTDSIFCEYFHLEEIHKLGSELIEMETAAFIRSMELVQKPHSIILCVSDNSSCGHALFSRSMEATRRFYEARETFIPQLILAL